MTPIIAALSLLLTTQAETTHQRRFNIEVNFFAIEGAEFAHESQDVLHWRFAPVDANPVQDSPAPFHLDLDNGAPIFDDGSIGVSVLARPRVLIPDGEELRINNDQEPIQYFERMDQDTLNLRASYPAQFQYMTILARTPEQRDHVLLRTEISIRFITGRTPINGIGLPIGPPVYQTLHDELEGTFPLGEWHVHACRTGENRYLLFTYRVRVPPVPVEQALNQENNQ